MTQLQNDSQGLTTAWMVLQAQQGTLANDSSLENLYRHWQLQERSIHNCAVLGSILFRLGTQCILQWTPTVQDQDPGCHETNSKSLCSGRGKVNPTLLPWGNPSETSCVPSWYFTKGIYSHSQEHTVLLEFWFSFVSVILQFMLACFPQHLMQRAFSSQLKGQHLPQIPGTVRNCAALGSRHTLS